MVTIEGYTSQHLENFIQLIFHILPCTIPYGWCSTFPPVKILSWLKFCIILCTTLSWMIFYIPIIMSILSWLILSLTDFPKLIIRGFLWVLWFPPLPHLLMVSANHIKLGKCTFKSTKLIAELSLRSISYDVAHMLHLTGTQCVCMRFAHKCALAT